MNRQEINLSEDNKWDAIKKSIWNIEFIENPTEEMSIFCVKKAWNALKFIKNPSKNIIDEAIKSNGWAIQFVKNPSYSQMLLAVENNWESIKFINDPIEEIQLAAINLSHSAIKFIRNPSFNAKLASIIKNPEAIKNFEYNEEEFIYLVKHNLNILKYVAFDKSKIIDLLKEILAKDDIEKIYIYDYIKINNLGLDKNKLIYEYGSKLAKKYYIDLNLDI